VIDARTGRSSASCGAPYGRNFNDDVTELRSGRAIAAGRRGPRAAAAPASVPHVASRTPTVPMPKASPPRAGEPPKAPGAKPAPEPAQQSAAVQGKPADAAPTAARNKPPRRGCPAKPARRTGADAGDAEGAGAGVGHSVSPRVVPANALGMHTSLRLRPTATA